MNTKAVLHNGAAMYNDIATHNTTMDNDAVMHYNLMLINEAEMHSDILTNITAMHNKAAMHSDIVTHNAATHNEAEEMHDATEMHNKTEMQNNTFYHLIIIFQNAFSLDCLYPCMVNININTKYNHFITYSCIHCLLISYILVIVKKTFLLLAKV